MQVYMKNGYANKHFVPNGKHDKNNDRTGKWKDYEVSTEGDYLVVDSAPMMYIGTYLFYGEGEFYEGKRTGEWKLYVIEDKSLKKILSKKVNYNNGVRVGNFECYYPDGHIAQTGRYTNGKIEGRSTMYYNTGKVFGEQSFADGNKTGVQKYYYPGGKLNFTIEYNNGTRDGKCITFYEDSTLKETKFYKADSIDGSYKYYYPNGRLWTERIYNNGALLNVTQLYDKNGGNLNKGTLNDGNGTVNFYTEDGKIYMVQTYTNGRVIKEETK